MAKIASHFQLFHASAKHYAARIQNILDSLPLKMGQIDCPEKSVRNGHYSNVDNPEQRTFQATIRPMRARNIELLTWPNIAQNKMDAISHPLQINSYITFSLNVWLRHYT
jgi:hypothetical protein